MFFVTSLVVEIPDDKVSVEKIVVKLFREVSCSASWNVWVDPTVAVRVMVGAVDESKGSVDRLVVSCIGPLSVDVTLPRSPTEAGLVADDQVEELVAVFTALREPTMVSVIGVERPKDSEVDDGGEVKVGSVPFEL